MAADLFGDVDAVSQTQLSQQCHLVNLKDMTAYKSQQHSMASPKAFQNS